MAKMAAEHPMASKLETAKAIFEAYVAKDRKTAEALLTDDFRFTSPLDNALDRRTYFEICWPNSQSTEGFDFKHIAEDGDRVFVTYEATGSGGRRFRNTEMLTIRGNQVAAVEVYFGWNVPHDVPAGTHRDPGRHGT
jgi:ketosteroid isomerase-like protein